MKKKAFLIGIMAVVIAAIGLMIYASVTLNKEEENLDQYLVELTIDELQEKINNKDSFILVISQTTCSHCAEYKPRLKKILQEYNIVGYYIEKDTLNEDEESKLSAIASISGTPTTIFIENGEEVSTSSRISGARDNDAIISRLKAMGYISE